MHDRVGRPGGGDRLRHLVAPLAGRLPEKLGDRVVLLVLHLERGSGRRRPARSVTAPVIVTGSWSERPWAIGMLETRRRHCVAQRMPRV